MKFNKLKFTILAMPLLLASTVVAEAQGMTSSGFALTGTGGVVGFNLPSFDTGYFGHSVGGTMIGGMFGANLTGVIGRQGDRDVLLGISIFGAYANATSNFTDTLSGMGTVTIAGASTPAGGSGGASTIDVTAGAGGATTAVTNNNPQGGGAIGSASATGATNNVGFVQPSTTGKSFIVGAAASTGAAAGTAAYGAMADSSGGIFLGTGDLTGLKISTSVERAIQYGGADITLGLNGNVNETTQLLFYGGPSVRLLNENDTTKVTATIPSAGTGSATTFPNFSVSGADQLTSQYWGGVIGSALAFQASPGVQFTLGAEGGLYAVKASWNGQDTYSTCCGNFNDNTIGNSTGVNGASPPLTVSSNPSSFDFGTSLGFAVRGNGGVSFDIGGNKAISLGANVEYLSRVAQVGHTGLGSVATAGAGSASFSSATAVSTAPSFSWGSMVNYGFSASLTGRF